MYNACHITVTLSTIQPSFRGDVEQLDKVLAKMIVPRSLLEVSMQRCSRLVVGEKLKFIHTCGGIPSCFNALWLQESHHKSEKLQFPQWSLYEVCDYRTLECTTYTKKKPSSLAQCELISNLLGQPSYQPLYLLLHCHAILIILLYSFATGQTCATGTGDWGMTGRV